jgi:GAF domain-containing protein
MRAVFDMVATLTSTLSLDKLLDYVVKLCAELTGCAGALVYLWDEDRERLVVRAGVEGYEQWIGRFSMAMGEGLTGWTALTRQPGIIRDNPTADPRFKSVPELNDDRLQSYLTIPIVSPSDSLLGVVTLHTGAPHEFDEDDLTLMHTLSQLIGVAVENAQLYERRDRQVKVLHSLSETSNAVVQTSTLQQMLHRIASTAGPLLGADHCAVLTLDEEGTHLSLETLWSRGQEKSAPAVVPADGHWARALGASAPTVLTRREHRETFAAFDAVVPHARSALVAPMRVSERAVGLFLCFSQGGHMFGAEDRELLSTVAPQAALAVQNARLIEALTERNVVRDLFEALMLGDEGEIGLELRAHRLGVDLARPSVIVTFEIDSRQADEDGDRAWSALRQVWSGLRQELAGSFPGTLSTYRDHTMTALVRLSETTGVEALAERLDAAAGRHERPPELLISAGVSRVCRGAADYPDAFEQSRQALLMGRTIRGPGSVVSFDELGAQWHLFSVAQQQVRDVYQERLEALLEHDRAHGSQLFRTVEVYLECQGNAKLAAERLYIHRNTLRQRFEKIAKVTGMNLSDTDRWFDLMMAVRIIRLRELSAYTPRS